MTTTWRKALVHGLALSLALLAAPPANSRDEKARTEAEAVLKKAGLTRQRNSFVLDGDATARKRADAVEKLEAKVARDQREVRDNQKKEAREDKEADRVRDQIQALKRKMANTKGDDPDIRRQIRRLEDRVRELEKTSPREKKEAAEDRRDFQEDKRKLLKEQNELRELISKTQKTYDALANDKAVVAALRTLNRGRHPKVALGPITDYERNVYRQSVGELASLGLTVDKALVYLSAEDAIDREITDAIQRFNKARRADQLSADLKREFAEITRDLRGQIAKLGPRREELDKDEHIADLVAEVQKRTNGKVRIAPGPALSRGIKDLEIIEAATQDGT